MCEIERLTRDMNKIEASVRVFVLVFSSSRTQFKSSGFSSKSSGFEKNSILKVFIYSLYKEYQKFFI